MTCSRRTCYTNLYYDLMNSRNVTSAHLQLDAVFNGFRWHRHRARQISDVIQSLRLVAHAQLLLAFEHAHDELAVVDERRAVAVRRSRRPVAHTESNRVYSTCVLGPKRNAISNYVISEVVSSDEGLLSIEVQDNSEIQLYLLHVAFCSHKGVVKHGENYFRVEIIYIHVYQAIQNSGVRTQLKRTNAFEESPYFKKIWRKVADFIIFRQTYVLAQNPTLYI